MGDGASRESREKRTRIVDDLRGLGLGAPLRMGYEASKRAGGHALVFGRLVPTRREPTGVSPFSFGAVPEAARSRVASEANRIADGTIELFGRELILGEPPDWHAAIHNENSWPRDDWWKIDLRSDARPGDVKWAWELGRHRHLVILARAVFLELGDERYLSTLVSHLNSWIEENPPEVGVHWYSNLEISLRSLAWLQILALAERRLPPDLVRQMWRHLYHSGRHLVADLPYTISTMRNNHLLGDALGLIALGKAFTGTGGRTWTTIGDRLFNSQMQRQMRPDGSMIEDSLSYQRFTLEMLSIRVVLGGAPPDVHVAMVAAAQLLARLGVLDGPVPQYGDWDQGRVVAVADDPSRLAGSVRLALALGGSGAPSPWRADHDEVAWFCREGKPVQPDPTEKRGHDVGGGIARAAAGDYTVWLKAESGPSHGHADLSSVTVSYRDRVVIGDPGTGTYNGSESLRNTLRGSAAHNVRRVQGLDQMVPHRVFRWRHHAEGMLGRPEHVGDATLMWATHTAYERLDPPRRVVRVVAVRPSGVLFADWIEGASVETRIAIPLHPGCRMGCRQLSPSALRIRGCRSPPRPNRMEIAATPHHRWDPGAKHTDTPKRRTTCALRPAATVRSWFRLVSTNGGWQTAHSWWTT